MGTWHLASQASLTLENSLPAPKSRLRFHSHIGETWLFRISPEPFGPQYSLFENVLT